MAIANVLVIPPNQSTIAMNKKHLFLGAGFLSALVLGTHDIARAHGGTYRGPGDIVPPGAGGGGGLVAGQPGSFGPNGNPAGGSASTPHGTPTPRNARTAVVVGKLFPRDGEELAEDAWRQLRSLIPNSSKIGVNPPAPSNLMAALCDRLIVLDDVDDSDRVPYAWSPMQVDNSTLADWAALPCGAERRRVGRMSLRLTAPCEKQPVVSP